LSARKMTGRGNGWQDAGGFVETSNQGLILLAKRKCVQSDRFVSGSGPRRGRGPGYGMERDGKGCMSRKAVWLEDGWKEY